MDANAKIAGQHLFTRLPLADGSMDHVLGVVPTKDFLTAYYEDADSSVLPLLASPALFVPENVSLDMLLEQMQQRRADMAFLVDEIGGVEGIVTLQDVLDELLGEHPSTTSESDAQA
jgi:putative hemolysin